MDTSNEPTLKSETSGRGRKSPVARNVLPASAGARKGRGEGRSRERKAGDANESFSFPPVSTPATQTTLILFFAVLEEKEELLEV